jgi:four helix bundle protein
MDRGGEDGEWVGGEGDVKNKKRKTKERTRKAKNKSEGMMDYKEWEKDVPEAYKVDSIWKVTAYRLALYLSDLCWQDLQTLFQDKHTMSIADQLYRAVGSISANLVEGYSRVSGKDRALFYQYSLGSTREARDWYFEARHVLGEETFNHRVQVITEILRLLVKMIS